MYTHYSITSIKKKYFFSTRVTKRKRSYSSGIDSIYSFHSIEQIFSYYWSLKYSIDSSSINFLRWWKKSTCVLDRSFFFFRLESLTHSRSTDFYVRQCQLFSTDHRGIRNEDNRFCSLKNRFVCACVHRASNERTNEIKWSIAIRS